VAKDEEEVITSALTAALSQTRAGRRAEQTREFETRIRGYSSWPHGPVSAEGEIQGPQRDEGGRFTSGLDQGQRSEPSSLPQRGSKFMTSWIRGGASNDDA
jgi:hypothetical protein